MKEEIAKRIEAARALMEKDGIDAVIIPQTDPHQSEYISDHWQARRFMTGFTGSAGTLVITRQSALLWVDSRYYLQGAIQLQDTPIELMKDGTPGTPSIEGYLTANLKAGATVGIDGMLFSKLSAEQLRSVLEAHSINLDTDYDIICKVWTDRPALPKDKIFEHELKYAGEDAKSKLAGVLAKASEAKAEAAFISALDEIAWTLNIRCTDVEYNPVATSYLYVVPEGTILFIDADKVSDEMKQYLSGIDVKTMPYEDVTAFLSALPGETRVLLDGAHTSITISSVLGDRAVYGDSPVAVAKGCRNDVQIAGIRSAMERDGVALVKAFKDLDEMMARGDRVTEKTVERLLLKYRSEQPLFFDESFGTIAGYGAHGAIVHYEATEESDVEIEPHGLLLVDSGAQYLDGTTDITRTIAMGEPTAIEKHDFTLVMKGHIALDTMIFPKGTRGAQLDVEARKYLWREGLTYMHGTGHGVGHFLNVHEGPQTIRLNDTPTQLMEGMVTSNEPGLYRENVHGVRCENLVLCVKAMTTECGEFLKFETLTLFPFDIRLFETEIMTAEEIAWVNDYHAEVYRRLSPMLDEAERRWLMEKTQQLTTNN